MKTKLAQTRQIKATLLFVALLVVLLALAAGVSSVQLVPAERFPAELFALPSPLPGQTLEGGQFLIDLARLALVMMLLLTPVYVVYALFNRKRRKELITQLVVIGATVLLLSNVSQCARNQRQAEEIATSMTTQEAREEAASETVLPPFDPNAPDWLVLISSAVLSAALVITVSLVVVFGIARRRHKPAVLDQMAQQAEQAVADLEAGGEFRDIIIRCYREMSSVLQQERGIRRDAAMTPREFMDVLRSKGLPAEPVRQLTLAFEASRYGHASATEQQERAAVDSLRAIVDACRAVRGAP
ncbi:MAG: DUF4129 domain-containing protein [Candidatus Roseilinea sp.]|uniref:DUF4129 domain-containing protein n=1 Tax=Candidatus Roseilinea sp. TaxID=2838777 RepID=UPI00404A82C9